MGQYDSMKFWKQTRARTFKICQMCNEPINIGDTYYCERLTDPKVNFIGKKICSDCYKNQIINKMTIK